MEATAPAAYKYQADTGSNTGMVLLLIVSLIVSFIGIASFSKQFGWGFLISIFAVIRIARSAYEKKLVIASRYLIAGNDIIYFCNVSKVRLDRNRQTLVLFSERGGRILIEAEKFPTDARKPEKIKNNRTARFEKVTGKILQRLPGVVPEISG